MSKAFTRESDDLPERPALPRPLSSLPPGAKNYLTSDGERRLREELENLVQVERPRLAGLTDDDAKRRLQLLDQRIGHFRHSLQSAEVVARPALSEDRVRFGATVTVREPGGSESSYRIVGVDEIDFDKGWISWLSPMAKALLNAKVGQQVQFKSPSGEQILEVVSLIYE